jgi:hypothetical protein
MGMLSQAIAPNMELHYSLTGSSTLYENMRSHRAESVGEKLHYEMRDSILVQVNS